MSLGDREERTRNPVMATVGDRIRETYRLLIDQEIRTTLEWNEGNHFRDAGLRMAKAFAWVMNQCGESGEVKIENIASEQTRKLELNRLD